MANVEPNFPIFFNMHSTSHSGYLTSFSSLYDYTYLLRINRITPSSTGGLATALDKRPVDHVAPPKPVLAKRSKILAHKDVLDLTDEPLCSAPPSDMNLGEVPLEDTPMVQASSSKGEESDSAPKVTAGYSATYLDLPYTLSRGYEVTNMSKLGKALDACRATRPLLLEEIGKPYKEYNYPLELKGVIAKHLAINASHVLARRVDRLNVDLGLNRESERASRFKALVEISKCKDLEAKNVQLKGERFDLSLKLSRLELSLTKATKRAKKAEHKALMAQESANKAVEEYRTSKAFHNELGEETTYYLCRFVKTFKDINPSLVSHYQVFTSGYPPHWFSSLDINAPLSPLEGEGNECVSKALGPPQLKIHPSL
ncbi:hypothetical protein LIER_35355 [Lithospermum erythrorhizon]|uniref:Uncharacterized protein n=1 Tax=Lithospermum erythrorhizon TaxID=34254 RepID=A0AAV3NQS9_LITER